MGKQEREKLLSLFRLALREYRVANGNISQENLAGLIGINKLAYHKIEKGTRNPGTGSGPKLVEYFQSLGNAAADNVVRSLLRLGGFDIEALAAQLESAAWHYPPELPRGPYPVNVSYCYRDDRERVRVTEGYYSIGGKWVLCWVKDMGNIEVIAWQPLPKPATKEEANQNEE